MFDHLDDPRPFTPSEGMRDHVLARGRRRRRHHRLVTSGVITVVVVVVSVVAVAALAERRLGDVGRMDVQGLTTEAAHGSPTTFLLVGSDSGIPRPGFTGAAEPFADSIVVAHIDPNSSMIDVLPIPRDLLVDVPGHGQDRIDRTLLLGGPSLLVRTLRTTLGLTIDHYVGITAAGAAAVTDALGGIDLAFPTPVRDPMAGIQLRAGCQHLSGSQVVALGRARHLQWLRDGIWHADPTGDLGRIDRGQVVAEALLERVRAIDITTPSRLVDVVGTVLDHVVVDSGLGRAEMADLARAVHRSHLRSHRLVVEVQVLNSGPSRGAAVLALGSPASEETASFRSGTPDPAPGSGGPRSTVPVVCSR